jgi:protein O-GlcNAc transferase
MEPRNPSSRPVSIPDAIKTALEHHKAGRLRKAEDIYRNILRASPDHPDALHLLGLIAHQVGKHEAAIELIRKAIAIRPSVPDFHNNLGEAYRALRRYGEARARYEHALSLRPDFSEAHNNLALVLLEEGDREGALKCVRRALELKPDSHEALNNYGFILLQEGKTEEAVGYFRRSLSIRPDYADPYLNLGNVSREQGRTNEAIGFYRRALELRPNHGKTHNNLGTLFQELGDVVQATAHFEKAIAAEPNNPDPLNNLAMTLHEQGRVEEAINRYEAALAVEPSHVRAMWGLCMAQLPLFYEHAEEIPAARGRYRESLERLGHSINLDNTLAIQEASRAVATSQPYYLAYQCENDRDLQGIYGSLVCRIQAARYPHYAEPLTMPDRDPDGRIRVGIVSGFFRYHSVWKMRIRGWLESLDRRLFSLYGYHTGRQRDAETDRARELCARFVEGGHSVENVCEEIRRDNLHVLIYPELGMDPMALRLASLRLAPVQCMGWSHPETSGLPTIDYFLGNELMETPDGDEHYTEKLMRLPHLGVCYIPFHIEPARVSREDFGLSPSAHVYFCGQFLPKYLPRYDEVFPRIAAEVRGCQFVFIGFPKGDYITERFRHRLSEAFRRLGMKAEDHVVILPYMDTRRYQALNLVADVFLDSIGWNGCNTTLEAIACNLPVVTMPGRLMRERHSFGILAMMGATETITRDVDDYIALAVRLGKEPAYRRSISDLYATHKQKLYNDLTPIRALEEFLERTVGSKQ